MRCIGGGHRSSVSALCHGSFCLLSAWRCPERVQEQGCRRDQGNEQRSRSGLPPCLKRVAGSAGLCVLLHLLACCWMCAILLHLAGWRSPRRTAECINPPQTICQHVPNIGSCPSPLSPPPIQRVHSLRWTPIRPTCRDDALPAAISTCVCRFARVCMCCCAVHVR